MAWWNKLFGDSGPAGRVAYYDEGLALIAEDKVHEALTSFRLALKASPGDVVVLQQIAIAYTRIGMTEEAGKDVSARSPKRHSIRGSPLWIGVPACPEWPRARGGSPSAGIP